MPKGLKHRHDHPTDNVRFVVPTSNTVDYGEDEENVDMRERKRQIKRDLVGVGGVEGRTGGVARGGEGFKRRMTSVGRSVEGYRGWSGGNRATLVVAINTTPPRLAFATTYLSRRVAREQNLTLSLRHEPEGGIVEPENADHLGLGRVRALTPLLSCKNHPPRRGKNTVCSEKETRNLRASIYHNIKINLRMSYFSKQQF